MSCRPLTTSRKLCIRSVPSANTIVRSTRSLPIVHADACFVIVTPSSAAPAAFDIAPEIAPKLAPSQTIRRTEIMQTSANHHEEPCEPANLSQTNRRRL